MGIDQLQRWAFVRSDGWPRNFDATLVPSNTTYAELRRDDRETAAELRQPIVEAFKRTQRRIALGAVAFVGTALTVARPPENVADGLVNFAGPVLVQAITYNNFTKGMALLRDYVQIDTDRKDPL